MTSAVSVETGPRSSALRQPQRIATFDVPRNAVIIWQHEGSTRGGVATGLDGADNNTATGNNNLCFESRPSTPTRTPYPISLTPVHICSSLGSFR